MSYLQPFDPWKSPLCSCPPKWSLNPYTGCSHGCLYCYSSSFIPNFYSPRPKKDFLKKIERELLKLPQKSLISLSNSSDPYQSLEEKYKYIRSFLEMLIGSSFKLLILTKSDLVLRDLDLLSKIPSVISLTITSNNKLSKRMEPFAPSVERRLFALKELKKRGFKVVVRIDPLIPEINVDSALEILEETLELADHFVLSSYKAKPNNLKALLSVFKDKEPKLRKLYLKEGETFQGSRYFSLEKRKELLVPFIEKLQKKGKTFALCREGLEEFYKKGFCDGSFLLNYVPRGT